MYAWDVVNEAIDDVTAGLRDTIFLQKLGADYIAEAFRLAHQADPDALLFTTTTVSKARAAIRCDVPLVRGSSRRGADPRGWPANACRGGAGSLGRSGNMQRLPTWALVTCPRWSALAIRDRRLRQARVYHDVVAACVAVPRCTRSRSGDSPTSIRGSTASSARTTRYCLMSSTTQAGILRRRYGARPGVPALRGRHLRSWRTMRRRQRDGRRWLRFHLYATGGQWIVTRGGLDEPTHRCRRMRALLIAAQSPSPKLIIGKLLPPGDDTLSVQGQLTLPVPLSRSIRWRAACV